MEAYSSVSNPIGSGTWRLALIVWCTSVGALILAMIAQPIVGRFAIPDPSAGSARVASDETSKPPLPAVTRADSPPIASSAVAVLRSIHARRTHHPAVRTLASASLVTHRSEMAAHSSYALDPSPQLVNSTAALAAVAGASTKGPGAAGSVSALSYLTRSANSIGSAISSMRSALSERAGISIHGLIDFGTNYNFNRPATGNNLYRVFDYFGASDFEPNQAELYINRSVPNQPGFVIDLNFLNTAQVMHGLTSYYGDRLGPQNPTGWIDPTQTYLTYTVPIGSGINLQAGRYTSLIGFEYIPTWNNTNFNQSIDLLYSLGEPFTLTGLRASYVFNKYVAATVGLNNGWDTIATRNVLQSVEAQLSLTPTENITWNMQGMFGPSTGVQSGSKRGLANTTLAWKTPYKPLQLGFEYLFADQSAPVLFSPLTEAPAYSNPLLAQSNQPILHRVWWSGVGVWAAYNLTDSIQLATRGEWFDDPSGARSGIAQNLGEITETLNYTIPQVSGLTARLEYRHDFSSAHPFPGPGPLVYFPCLGHTCSSTAHTYSEQDTFESALVFTF
jgi:Putative beta-barrel porin-2, OmpL-like. bbp2